MKHNFEEDMNKCKGLRIVKLDDATVEKSKDFVKKVVAQKMKESVHQKDGDSEFYRWLTGRLGECALEKVLHTKFCDWTVGYSPKYYYPDLQECGYDIGIKTVRYGKYPVVFKQSKEPEVICVMLSETFIIVCGVATVDVLSKYQDDDLIINDKLRLKGTKTGFYGFDKLIPVEQYFTNIL